MGTRTQILGEPYKDTVERIIPKIVQDFESWIDWVKMKTGRHKRTQRKELVSGYRQAQQLVFLLQRKIEDFDSEKDFEAPHHNHPPLIHQGCPRCIWDDESEDRRKALL